MRVARAIAGALLILAVLIPALGQRNSGSFAGKSVRSGQPSSVSTTTSEIVHVRVDPAYVVGGSSVYFIVSLADSAPSDGAEVHIKSSNPAIVATPPTMNIPFGQSLGFIPISISAVSAATVVAITASYGDTVAGTSLAILPAGTSATKSPFTLAVHPSTVTIAAGKSGFDKVTTKVTWGYSHALQLSASDVPAGISVNLNPATIPAPGKGTSKGKITIPVSAQLGSFPIHMKASDGTTTQSATLTLNVTSSGPGATFQGCWYQKNGNRYQGVTVTVENAGLYPFDAVLYYGATCNPNDWADEFGFGQHLQFTPGYTWTFWFTDFGNQTEMSAIWYVGSDQSQCVNYATAPTC
jgi:hypothetical protein